MSHTRFNDILDQSSENFTDGIHFHNISSYSWAIQITHTYPILYGFSLGGVVQYGCNKLPGNRKNCIVI